MGRFALVLVLALSAGCGDDGGSPAPADAANNPADATNNPADATNNPADATSIDGLAGAFTLISTAFTQGTPIPSKHTCDGTDVSPQLSWSNPPAGTMSFAFVLDDITFTYLHSTGWNIPLSRTSLDEAIPNTYEPFGAGDMRQSGSFRPGVIGYAGPCPPSGSHTYRYTVYAIPTPTIDGLTESSSRAAARSAIVAAAIGSADLDGTYVLN